MMPRKNKSHGAWTPEKREAARQRAIALRDAGILVPKNPPPKGPAHHRYGAVMSEESRNKIRDARLGKPGHPHTDAERERISAGNMRSIQTGRRTYRFMAQSPCGAVIPCRSRQERDLAECLAAEAGVRSVVGEDRMEAISYEIGGQTRRTVGDFLVTRADGVQVLVEGKGAACFYRDRDRARLMALWKWSRERSILLIVAMNTKPMPSVWSGPFVTEEFMTGVAMGRVRYRTMRTVAPSADAAPSACASPTCPLVSTLPA